MAIPESVLKCVAILNSAKTDTEKFAGLFMVTKLTKSEETSSEAKKLLFESIGIDFLKRLIQCQSVPPDCPPQVYKSVALAIFSSFCNDVELAHHPDILSSIPCFLEIVQQADTDDYEDNLMIVGEAYECLRCIAESDEGKKALLDQGVVVKMADIYSLQSFQTDEALQILVTLVQHFGPLAWDKENPRYFHSLMNKVALDFETDHSERKFELCGVLEALVISSDRKTIMSTYQEESWSTSVYKGLNDILTSKIGKAQRDPALKLAAAMIDLLGVEWTLTDAEKPKQFFLLLVHLGSVEVRMQLEDRNFEVILKNVNLITSCFMILELSVSYIANDSLDLEQKEKQQLYTALKGAFSAVLGTIKKYVSRISMNKQQSEEGKLFVCALVRVLAAWLAQETSAMRSTVYELFPFILSVANDSFYSYRSHYVSEKVKSTALVSSGHSHQVDVLRVMLPALCHFTIEDKGRKIMLDSKEDEILLECFTFHWSIVNYKRPPIPKSERLKAKKEPVPELPASLIDEMNESKAAMVSMCNIFMNIIVLEPKLAENSPVFAALLKFILNNLTELKNIPENLVLHGNMAVLGLLLLKQQSKKVKKNDFSICRYIQSAIRFLWDAYNVDESNDSSTLVVSMTYKKYWIEIMELWFLGMQTISVVLTLIPWISEFAMETGWAQGIIETLKKVKVGSLPSNTKSAYEDFLCHLVDTNMDVAPVLKEHDVLTVCRKHMMMELGKRLFGD